MKPQIRMETLATLDAIDCHGSFAAAASALHRVPSAVTYAIRQLESDLGVELFDRAGHRAVLTPAGRLVLDEGRRILHAGDELATAARRAADDWEPELRIAIDALVSPSTLWSAVEAFSVDHPEVDIRIMEEVLGGTIEALTANHADLAIAGTEIAPGPGIRRTPFIDVPTVFCCAPHHPLAAEPEPVADETRRRHRAIAVSDTARQLVPRSHGLLDGQPRLTVRTMQTKIDALIRGLGVGYCPRGWAADALANGQLVEKQLTISRAPVSLALFWHHGARGRALHWFLDRLSGFAEHARA